MTTEVIFKYINQKKMFQLMMFLWLFICAYWVWRTALWLKAGCPRFANLTVPNLLLSVFIILVLIIRIRHSDLPFLVIQEDAVVIHKSGFSFKEGHMQYTRPLRLAKDSITSISIPRYDFKIEVRTNDGKLVRINLRNAIPEEREQIKKALRNFLPSGD